MALVIHMHWTLLQIQVLFYHAVPCQSMPCHVQIVNMYIYIYIKIYIYIYAHMGIEFFATVNDEETPGSFWAT